MLRKQNLFVFPTSRSIRHFLSNRKDENSLLPFCLTIDEFFKKSINLEGKKFIDEEQRVLYLSESIKNINVEKLGISNNFTKFLKQSDYIYRFFLELSSEKVEINEIKSIDTYDYYFEHLEILTAIEKNFLEILEENNCVDRITLAKNYTLNNNFLNKFDSIVLNFEGYFTKVEFDIVKRISEFTKLFIKCNSNEYNQKSLQNISRHINEKFEIDFEYMIDLSNKEIVEKKSILNSSKNIEIKAFNSRINQIAYIKSSVVKAINKGIDPSDIVVVLPDETFASSLQLFDTEKYFNYAMGKSIVNEKLYHLIYTIYNYINEDEIKNKKAVEYFNIDKNFVDSVFKFNWNKRCNLEVFDEIIAYIKQIDINEELEEKFDEVVYKIKQLFFTSESAVLLKDVFKILLQKVSKISLDDVNSGKVTVMGLLETRVSSFNTVIICDFNESFIPKKSVKDKFLSTKIKEKINLPTSFDREMLQKYYYKRLLDGSSNLFISYVSSDTNQISRFANELFPNHIESKINDNSYKHILYNNHQIIHFDENLIEKIDLTKLEWSASSLKIFLQCKRKFYLQYILKIKEHNLSLKPKAFELGDIIHTILEKYYTVNDSSNELSYEKIEELFNQYKSDNPFLILDLEVWKKKLYDFYLYDLERLKNRKILDLEKKFNIVFDGIKLKGVIDRVDKYDNIYEIIDYKTSSSLKVDTARNYEKSVDFQLEFYYLAAQELYKTDTINSYYYDLHNTKLIEEITLDKKLELLCEKFDEIKELSKNEITFNKCEEKSTCQYCAYKIICNRE